VKRLVPLTIAIVAGFTLIIAYFFPIAQQWSDNVQEWFKILAVGAMVLGGGNLIKLHLKKVSAKRKGWGYSMVTIVCFFGVLIVGFLKVGTPPNLNYPDYVWSGYYLQEGSGVWWIYQHMIVPLTSMMFAMLAFYVATAAFRAFRAKNIEATLLLVTAGIVLLGRTYAGVWLFDAWLPESMLWLRFDNLTEWIMNAPNTAGNRAIMIGIALGTVATSLRILLGVDRSYLGQD
jgi:ankyrin repeat protein